MHACTRHLPQSLIYHTNLLPLIHAHAPPHPVAIHKQRVKHNASVWLHAVFSRANMDPDAEEELPPGSVFTKSYSEWPGWPGVVWSAWLVVWGQPLTTT